MKANQLEFSHNNNIFLKGEMICFSSVRNQWVCDDLTENAWPTKGAKWTTRINPKLTIDHCTSTHKNMGPDMEICEQREGGATSLCMVLT